MNRGQLTWRTRRLAGLSETDDQADPVYLGEVVNEAYLDLCASQDWSFLRVDTTLNTVAGTRSYALPTAVDRLDSVVHDDAEDGPLLRPRPGRAHDAVVDEPDQDRPDEYVLRDPNTIELWPTPDAVYTLRLRGFEKPAPLAVDSDTPVFDDRFHPAIPYAAAMAVLEGMPREDGDDRLDRYERRVGRYLGRMWGHYQAQHDRTPLVLGGRATRRRSNVGYLRGL